jgi:membrane-associated phospholipid phosphatase
MDQKLLELINLKWTSPGLDVFMATMSNLDFWMLALLIIGICVLIFGRFRARAMVFCGVTTIAISDGLIVNAMKDAVERPRPHELLANVRQVRLQKTNPDILAVTKPVEVKMSRPKAGVISGRSFPSGHTVNNFCAAVVFLAFYPRWGWLYLVPAGLIAYSRVYVGSHWPSDILASFILAIGIALLNLSLLEFLWRRFAPTLMPAIYRDHPSLVGSAA